MEIVGLLTAVAPSGVIEWVGRDDPMVKRLLALRPDVYGDYTLESFERALSARARIVRRASGTHETRALYEFTTM